jgi:ABC-2 type transport system permease protein
MWMICKKEWQQFFSSLTGYIALVVFLYSMVCSFLFFRIPVSLILDMPRLEVFSTWLRGSLLFLVPTITMRSLADEYKSGTFELLKTMPLTSSQIVWGKFYGALIIVVTALLPTIIYAVSVQSLSVTGGIDIGGTIGSYMGLFF